MISPELGRAAFRSAMLIVLVALGLLVVLSPGTPEFAITVITLAVGVLFMALIFALVRLLT